MSIKEHPPQHVPVLLTSAIELMQPQLGENYLDLTAGYGGHAKAFLSKTDNYVSSTLVDRDDFAIKSLGHLGDQGVELIHSDFVRAAELLIAKGRNYNLILLDLGVSSPQLDRAERGFSFTNDGPLDMRMDNRQVVSADEVVNTATEAKLADIIETYGEEPRFVAERYARAIVDQRPISSTGKLAEVIEQAHVGRRKRIHPATRTFQAIRIEVNDELGQVAEILPLLPRLLATEGRVGVISFHSLEDRLVKRFFKNQAGLGYEAELELVNKKPISGAKQDVNNPRSRSAKLRVARKK